MKTFGLRIMVPFSHYKSEISSLCASITTKQRCEKTVRKLTAQLADIESERAEQLAVKVRERMRLEQAVAAVRQTSLAAIKEYKRTVSDRLKVVSWNSHARQTRLLEQIGELRR